MKAQRWLRWAAILGGIFTAPYAYAARAYVSNEDEHSISVLDTVRAEVIATIEVGKRPRGLKLDRDGARLYVAVSGMPKCPPTVPDEECAKQKRDLRADGMAIIDTAALELIKVLPGAARLLRSPGDAWSPARDSSSPSQPVVYSPDATLLR